MIKFLHFNNEAALKLAERANIKLGKKQLKEIQSRTLAVEVVSAESVKDIADNIDKFLNGRAVVNMNVGTAKVSLDDSYSRRVGREVSTRKMKNVLLQVKGLTLTPTHTFVNLGEVEGVELNLRLNRLTGYCTVTGVKLF